MLNRSDYVEKILSFVDMDVIKVITGIRRCGKSVIMKQVQEALLQKGIKEQQMIYYNFESFLNDNLLDAKKLYQAIHEQAQNTEGKVYIFLDEIQNVYDWQRCINSLQVDIACDIYLTGSNANLLSGELATYIAGRFVEIKVTPFSFREYVDSVIERGRSESVSVLFQEYVQYGGMPFVCYLEDKSKFQEYMGGIYNSVLLNDIITRHRIRSIEGLERILRYAIDNTGRLFSANGISKYLKNERLNISVDTVLNYLRFSQDALLLYKASKHSLEGKELLKTQEKYYICDHGFKEYLYGSNQRDIELVLENIVYMEMVRRGYDVSVGSIMNKEIDFICQKGKERCYLQVTYLMASKETREREFSPLLAIQDNYPKYVLSLDEFSFSDAGIIHCNIKDFLLNQKL